MKPVSCALRQILFVDVSPVKKVNQMKFFLQVSNSLLKEPEHTLLIKRSDNRKIIFQKRFFQRRFFRLSNESLLAL